jgi:hypothetical protein
MLSPAATTQLKKRLLMTFPFILDQSLHMAPFMMN